MKFALFFGNRGFFPEKLIDEARNEIKAVVEGLGHETLIMPEGVTKYGAVESTADGKKYAEFLRGQEYDGVILSLPNFGDENGAIAALEDAGVPILVQAYPDEIGKMDFANRRDAFCGKFSVMDVFYQHGLPYTTFSHVCSPKSQQFRREVADFAAVCRVVKGMKRFTVGALGARTTAFKTIRFDEITLQKYGINTETIDLSEVFHRVEQIKPGNEAVAERKKHLAAYTDFSKVPDEKAETLARVSVVIDDIIRDYGLDCLALRCWNEFEMYLGIAPCVLLSELNDRGFVAACELDVCNAISMYAISLASEMPATCLDWNNNYGEEPDKCILFHCGPVPKTLMAPGSGHVTDHKMFKKSYGEGSGWGSNEGRIAPGEMTFASAKTHGGSLVFYIDEGEFTRDEIEKEFFGCGGVAYIPMLQQKLNIIGKSGYRHHVSVGRGRAARAIREAFGTYLKYTIEELDK